MAKGPVNHEGIDTNLRREALREHHLIDISGRDFSFAFRTMASNWGCVRLDSSC